MVPSGSVLLLLLLQLYLLCSTNTAVSAMLVAAAIIPHGDFAWDPTLMPAGSVERDAADEVARAARMAGTWLSETIQPDLIILSSPHGMSVSRDWVFYLASHASGYADIGQDLPPSQRTKKYRVPISIPLQPNVSQEIIAHLKPQAVTGLLNFADSEDMPLRWGEVIPLLLMNLTSFSLSKQQKATSKSETPSKHQPNFVILSHPLRRRTEAPQMIPELLTMGRSLRQWADSNPSLRVAMLVSADLSHRHLADGPYGYSANSVLMDAALGRWASDPWLYPDDLLITASSLQNDALACGFTGMVLLHGALVGDDDDKQLAQDQRNKQNHWNCNVLVNRNVTYYGMMASTFEYKKPFFANSASSVRESKRSRDRKVLVGLSH